MASMKRRRMTTTGRKTDAVRSDGRGVDVASVAVAVAAVAVAAVAAVAVAAAAVVGEKRRQTAVGGATLAIGPL